MVWVSLWIAQQAICLVIAEHLLLLAVPGELSAKQVGEVSEVA